MKDPHSEILYIETRLAGFTRDYVPSSSSDSAERQEEALRWVCAGLGFSLPETRIKGRGITREPDCEAVRLAVKFADFVVQHLDSPLKSPQT